MIHLKQKIAATAAVGTFMLNVITPVAAHSRLSSYGNGSRSDNNISVRNEVDTRIEQSNNAHIENNISARSNSGNNTSDENTGRRFVIRTGDANTSVGVSNIANVNYARVGTGGNSQWFDGDSDNHDRYKKDSEKYDKDKDYDHDKDYDKKHQKHANHYGGQDNKHDNAGKKHDKEYGENEHGDRFTYKVLSTYMNGKQEVPGPGDSDGSGWAKVSVFPHSKQVCVDMKVDNIEPATAAHIHEGAKGHAGPVVVTLPKPNAEGWASGCVSGETELLKKINMHPEHFYVNIHNTPYPNGAVRGQLHF